jgi:hypothetical protein
MVNLTLEMSDDLARGLANLSEAQRTSVQQLAIERLRSLVEDYAATAGTPGVLIRALHEEPHLTASDVNELEAAIAAGRLPVRALDIFPE